MEDVSDSGLAPIYAVWMLVLSVQNVPYRTVQISKGSFYLLICLCDKFLFTLNL